MYKIALIHTVPSVLNTFGDRVKKKINNVKIVNTLDEFLASDPAEKGKFTQKNKNRLFKLIKCAEMTEADAIVVTCSTMTPTVEKIKPFISIPLIAIDDEMIKKAVKIGTNITVMATAESTIDPTVSSLKIQEKKQNKTININILHCPSAYDAIKSNNKKFHDKKIIEKAHEIKNADVVILAQASMAHMEDEVEKICGCKVLSSPNTCINKLEKILNNQ
jgi:Asp/Glu/hydantoin racemase